MRPGRMVALTSVAVLCAASARAEFRRVLSEAEYMHSVAGNMVVSAESALRIAKDWTLAGVLADGTEVTGAWTWDSGYFCFNYRANRSRTYCQVIYIDGKRLRIVTDRGRGETIMAQVK